MPAGSYLVTGGGTGINSCPVNTYSLGGTFNLTGSNSDNVVGKESCISCGSGKVSPIGSKSADACKPATGNCSISVSTNATVVSAYVTGAQTNPGGSTYPDTWNVQVSISGDGCNGKTLKMSGRYATPTGGNDSHTVSDGQKFNFTYRATINECATATATATLYDSDDKAYKSGSVSVQVKFNWHIVSSDACTTAAEYNAHKHSATEADNAGVDEYWIAKGNTKCATGGRQVDVYVRGCGGGGPKSSPNPSPSPSPSSSTPPGTSPSPSSSIPSSSTPPSSSSSPVPTSSVYIPIPSDVPITPDYACYEDTYGGRHWTNNPMNSWKKISANYADCVNVPTPSIPPSTKQCYIDDNGGYHWTDTPGSSWIIVPTISKERDCKNVEEDACYLTPSGQFEWGKHAKDIGYTLITSIDNTNDCEHFTQDYACYVNSAGVYKWASQALTGYTKVDGVTSPVNCGPKESEACYLVGSGFVWGKYENVTGYIKIENITSESSCIVPDTDACYVDSNGNYVWGKYSGDSKYFIVPSVSNKDQCKNTVHVVSTGVNVSTIVYVFMAILMAFGIGFIYYSTVLKKKN